MDTDVRTVALVNGAPIPVIPLRRASSPPPNDVALRHWRDRARTAEAYAQVCERLNRDLIDELELRKQDRKDLQEDVRQLEAYGSDLANDLERLRSDRWFRRTIVFLAALLLGYAVGVLMR